MLFPKEATFLFWSRLLNKCLDSSWKDVVPWHKCIEPCLSSINSHINDQEVRQWKSKSTNQNPHLWYGLIVRPLSACYSKHLYACLFHQRSEMHPAFFFVFVPIFCKQWFFLICWKLVLFVCFYCIYCWSCFSASVLLLQYVFAFIF